jgi:hypothetical protein
VGQSSPTVLASGPIVRSADAISIELHQPDSMPAAVRVVWATAATVTTPAPLQRNGQRSHAATR